MHRSILRPPVGDQIVNNAANALAVLRQRPRAVSAYRIRPVTDPDGKYLILALAGSRGMHSHVHLPPGDALKLARQIEHALDPEHVSASSPPSADVSELHDRDLTLGERIAAAWSLLRGVPRRADVWAVRHLKFHTGREMVIFVLASRRERNAHTELPLITWDARALGRELKKAVAAL